IHQMPPPVLLPEIAQLLPVPGGPAVAQVVVSHHRDPVAGQEESEMVIPSHMLRDAVDQLHHCPWSAGGGQPAAAVDPVDTIAGGEIKFLFQSHRNATPFVVNWIRSSCA